MRIHLSVAALTAAAALAPAANATTMAALPPGYVSGYILTQPPMEFVDVTGFGTTGYSGTDADGTQASASFTAVGKPPRVTSSSSLTGQASYDAAQAHGAMGYYVEVTGPAGSVNVRVKARGATYVGPPGPSDCSPHSGTCATGFTAYAEFGLYPSFKGGTQDNSGALLLDDGGTKGTSDNINGLHYDFNTGKTAADGSVSFAFSDNWTIALQTNTLYFVRMIANTDVLLQAETFSELTRAWVDPTFSIAPGVAGASNYGFAFSDGFGNGPAAVAEPGQVALLGGGVAAGLIAGRRRRAR